MEKQRKIQKNQKKKKLKKKSRKKSHKKMKKKKKKKKKKKRKKQIWMVGKIWRWKILKKTKKKIIIKILVLIQMKMIFKS